jgi:hypothetical protein
VSSSLEVNNKVSTVMQKKKHKVTLLVC